MTQSKNTKRALLASVLSMVLCAAMLIGSTFAWFTDSVTSSNNRIVAGNLDVDLIMDKAADGNYVSIADGTGDIFSETGNGINWEPGKTEIVYLGVQNKGSLALKYNILLNVQGELAGALEYAVLDGAQAKNLAEVKNWADLKAMEGAQTGDIQAGTMTAAPNGRLDEIVNEEKNETDYFALAVHMKEEAGNEYMEKAITIDVTVVAAQADAESDSFGNDYDENADWPAIDEPEFPVPGPGEEEKEVSDLNGLNGAISNGNPANPDRIFIELNNTDPINTAIGNAAVRYLTKTTVIRSADGTEKVLSANDKTGAFRFGDKSFDESGVSNLYLDNVTIEAMKHENQNYTGIRLGSGTGSGLANKTINVVGGTFKTDCNEGSDQTNASYRSGAFVVYNSQNVTINFTNVNFEFSDWAALVHEYDTAGKTNCANNTYNFINCTFTYVKSDGTKEVLAIDSWDDWAAKYLPDGVGSGTDPISGMFRPTKTSNSTFNFS